ncbi:MAG TPA: outer membrane protein transport protein [Chthoniobacterales bacterium]
MNQKHSLPSFVFRLRKLAVSVLLAGIFATGVRAGSFALNEQSVSSLGSAYAGGAAQAEDASTIFYNPAGLARLPGGELQVDGHYLIPTAYFQNQGSQVRAPGTVFNGEPLRGINSGDAGLDKLLPNVYLAQPLFHHPRYGDLTVGFGVSVPFGLETDYDSSWVGRYAALRTKLTTLDLQPSIAYRFFDRISIGLSLDVQYASARLSQAVDFGGLGAQILGQSFYPRLPAIARGPVETAYARAGFVPEGRDGFSELYGDGWDVGFTVGGLFEYLKAGENPFFQDGRIGVSYRSGITHNILGRAEFRDVPLLSAPGAPVQFPAAATLQNVFPDQSATARIDLPEVYHVSVYQRFLHQFALLGDLEWTRWSRLQTVPITFGNPGTPANILNLQYRDARRYAVGFEWYASKALTLRLGFAYDETPIRSAETRTPRIPDNSRYFLSAGLRYQPVPYLAFDLGYAHLFMPEADVNYVDGQGHNLQGRFEESVDIVSAAVTFMWGGPRTAPSSAAGFADKPADAHETEK